MMKKSMTKKGHTTAKRNVGSGTKVSNEKRRPQEKGGTFKNK